MKRASAAANSPPAITRRGALKTTAGLSAAALGVGAGLSGSAAGNIDEGEFQQLSVSDDNRIVDEDGETFVMRGVNVPDPKRGYRTRHVRGKTPIQLVDLLTNNEAGWHPRVLRVPAQPADIGEHPMGHTGPEYEDGELESPDVVRDDRRKMRPPQPTAFDREELRQYLDEYYDPVVERCRERGVYCIVDFHRHWHEQPPGDPNEDLGPAENHLPYDSEYTNYWARNTYSGSDVEFTEADPASWFYVDQTWIDAHGYGTVEGPDDLGGTPFAAEHWQVNEPLLEEAQLFWEEAAERYGDMDHVIFEPYNEPTAPGIWGPVEGCGADKQRGLWDTFLDDFMGPIIDTIRDGGYDGLILSGVPGWCQSLQGLHWRSFEEAGYEDVAVTWHNYAGHDVSQLHNWFNDTDYQSPQDVEAETGEALEDPYLAPPDRVDNPDCWGWEGYEAAGLQEAMDYAPVAVTEFGWEDRYSNTDHWVHGVRTGTVHTTTAYGEPFIQALEEDDRVSWVAWCADVRWTPRMFEFPDGPDEGDIEDVLENDNFYDTTFEDLPQPCEDLPCEWELLDGSDSGQYVKATLEAHSEESVPFDVVSRGSTDGDAAPSTSPTSPSDAWTNETTATAIDLGWESVAYAAEYDVSLDDEVVETVSSTSYTIEGLDPETEYEIGIAARNEAGESMRRTTTVTTAAPDGEGHPCDDVGADDGATVDGQTVCDVDGDGAYMDVTGDGSVTNADVTTFFRNQHAPAWDERTDVFDFTGDDDVTQADVVALFRQL